MSTTATTRGRFDIDALKAAASGRWPEILSAVGGIGAEFFDGRHHPCPKCGGTDRARWDRENEFFYCNKCFDKNNGDGIAALQWLTGWDFPSTIKAVAGHVGVQPSRNSNGRAKANLKKSGAIYLSVEMAAKAVACRAKGKFIATWDYGPFSVARIDTPTPEGEKQAKEFRPVHPVTLADGRTAYKLGYPDGKKRPLYRLAELEAADDTALAVVGAGEKATDAAVKLGLVATTNAGGEQAVTKTDWKPLKKFDTIAVLVDNDATGEKFGQTVTAALFKLKPDAKVVILRLPDLPPKGDIVEWIAAGGGKGKFLALVDAAKAVTIEEAAGWEKASGKPRILIGFDEARVSDEAIQAILKESNLYQRGSKLVQVVSDAKPPRGIARPEGAPRIALLRQARLREIMAEHARWLLPGDEGPIPCHVPRWAVEAVSAREQWAGIRPIEGVVEAPVLRADGTILQATGYDADTGLLFQPRGVFPEISERLTIDDAQRATKAVLESVADFPFATPAHRSAWLAATLTPFARFAFYGCAPLNLIDANVRGCGKGLLADVTGAIFCWRGMARMTKAGDDDEFRKRITALAIAGDPLILIDNIAGFLSSPSLDAALTATSWSDRVLGKSEMVTDVPLTATWYATANNIVLGADTARRVLHIRLESPEEKPEERSGFQQPKLLEWVQQEQPRLAAAAVSILAAYCQAGKPDMQLRPWGSFEAWSELVRQAVVWAGLPDPAETRAELNDQADTEGNALRLLIDALEEEDPEGDGLTAAEMLKLIDHDKDGHHAALRNAIVELVPVRGGGLPSTRSLGNKLRHLRRRIVGGRLLDKRDAQWGALWSVRGSKPQDSEDSVSRPSRAGAHTRTHTHAGEVPQTEPSEPSEPTREDDCTHVDVAETATHDGYVNRTCRTCGENLGCQKKEPLA